MLEKDWKQYAKLIVLIAVIIGFIWIAGRISWVIQLTVISLLIVYALHPVVEFLKAYLRLTHFASVMASFILFVLAIVILISLIVPIIHQEIEAIIMDFPHYVRQIQNYTVEITAYLSALGVSEEYLDAIHELTMDLQPALEELANISISVVSGLIDIFFILFIVFYLLYDFENVRQAILSLVPQRHKEYSRDVLRIVDRNMGGFIRGSVIRCCLVGLSVGLLLYAIGMPHALVLGILAGVMDIILYFGPYIAAAPAVLLSLSPHTPSVITVLAIYIVIQVLESLVLSPLVLGKAVKLKPITVIVALLIGQQLAGFLGLILAVPLAGIGKNLLEYYLQRRDQQTGET